MSTEDHAIGNFVYVKKESCDSVGESTNDRAYCGEDFVLETEEIDVKHNCIDHSSLCCVGYKTCVMTGENIDTYKYCATDTKIGVQSQITKVSRGDKEKDNLILDKKELCGNDDEHTGELEVKTEEIDLPCDCSDHSPDFSLNLDDDNGKTNSKESQIYEHDRNMDIKTHSINQPNCNGEKSLMDIVCEKKFENTSEKLLNCNFYKCSIAGKCKLSKHTVIPTGKKPFSCHICEKRFTKPTSFKKHMLSHTGEKPHKCTICEKKFTQKNHLNQHMLIHTDNEPHICNICERKFSNRSNLNKHIFLHTGEKSHKCNICKKNFTQKTSLTNHMLTHTGEKPHVCNVCERKFSNQGNLHKHMLIHTGEKPHKCHICEKNFTRKTSLTDHMLIHTGEKPHKCTICKWTFSLKNHLKRHMLTHNA